VEAALESKALTRLQEANRALDEATQDLAAGMLARAIGARSSPEAGRRMPVERA
jgi:hypothetical protein